MREGLSCGWRAQHLCPAPGHCAIWNLLQHESWSCTVKALGQPFTATSAAIEPWQSSGKRALQCRSIVVRQQPHPQMHAPLVAPTVAPAPAHSRLGVKCPRESVLVAMNRQPGLSSRHMDAYCTL
eukprot:GHRQ01030961.1.p1 GENE.GHRQ01030961.1~~GHRQ01030961.1.p1  ORF type:complete len:125 (+),score=0.07 GHRQ01030961.1:1012-1386(+)